jgi:YCII-related domain
MKRFLLLYNGPPAPPDPSHEGWPEWFAKIGDALVDRGSPLTNGAVLHRDGSTGDDVTSLDGFSVIQAEDRNAALDLLSDHPFLALGKEYTIEVFEAPNR